MAVEANIRKRKHKASSGQVDDGEAAVPKKMSKKSETPEQKKSKIKHKKNANSTEAETIAENGAAAELAISHPEHLDSGIEVEEKKIKFGNDFKMLDFRTKLRQGNFITELRHFLHLSERSLRIVAKYLEKRGKPLELVDAIDRIDKTNVFQVSYLCQALQLVIMEVISNQKHHMEAAIQASRYFLKTHGGIIDLLLKSPQFKHRRIALKLMTALVCVEPQFGRQLLSSYEVLSNVKMIESLLSHTKKELGEEETVRKCFIHFVLAFLVDGNTLLIRNILDRGAVLRALISGLMYDDHVTVCVVLGTLKKCVLKCPEISKTKKMHVFDVECCKNILRLYQWGGPKAYAGNVATDTSSVELNSVVEATHDFFVLLLTSRKHGIAFDGITQYKLRHNALQGKLLGAVQEPWSHPLKTDLIIKVLTACPELARMSMRNYAANVKLFYMELADRKKAMDFLRQVVAALHPRLYENAIANMTLTDMAHWIKDTLLSPVLLEYLGAMKTANDKHYEHRLAVAQLLLAMFTQYSNFMQAIMKREQNKHDNTMRRFRFDMLNHILCNFPTMENIIISLRLTVKSYEDLSIQQVHAHLDVVFDIILVFCKEHRNFINRTNSILNFLNLMRPLFTDEDGIINPNAKHHNHRLEMKAVKTMLLLSPRTLQPTENLFKSILTSFIKIFVYGEPDVQREAGNLLRQIFLNVGIFVSGDLEIDLWLQALRCFDAETVDVVTKVFIEVLQVPKAEVDLPGWVDTETNIEKIKDVFAKIESGLSVQVYMETISVSKLMPLIFKGVMIVDPLKKYLELVCLLIFHYYPVPEYMMKIYEMEFTKLLPYMSSWLKQSGDTDVILLHAKMSKLMPQLLHIQEGILQGNRSFESIFASSTESNALALELKGKLQNLDGSLENERLVMIYMQQACFIIVQLLDKQQLRQEQAANAADFISNCLHVVAALEEQRRKAADDMHEANEHNFLNDMLHYIYSVRLNFIKNVEVFDASVECHLHYCHFLRVLTESCNHMENFELYTENYRLKLVNALAVSTLEVEQTKAQTEQLSDSLKLLEIFKLSAKNCLDILELLTTKIKYSDYFIIEKNSTQLPQKSIYYDILVCVLLRLAELKQCLACYEPIKKVAKFYVQFHKKISNELNLEKLEESLYVFLCMAHQHIPLLGAKFFDCFFVERKLTKSAIKLACLMLERDDELKEHFLALLPAHFTKKELIYPLLKIAFHKSYTIEATLLQSIYHDYKNGFMKTIEKPQKAGVIYKENVESSIALIEHCMPKSECVDFCNKNLKFDVIEVYQLRIVYAIYKRAFESIAAEAVKQRSVVFVNFVNTMVQMLSVDLKKQIIELEKLELFGYYLYAWWQQAQMEVDGVQQLSFEPDFGKLLKGQQWLNFCRSCLKLGMQQNESEADNKEADQLYGMLLKLLAMLCEQMYADYKSENGMEFAAEPAQLFEMICTHSKCFDILLSHKPTAVKTQVLHLLFVLGKKSPNALAQEQIPVILGAYEARLSDADRYALGLLQLYELYECGLEQYRPFIWGESAIAFYALRADEEDRSKLAQRDTSIAQVMWLIDKQTCDYTLENFPTWRKLNTIQQLPAVEFIDPQLKAHTFGSNSMERRIEWGQTEFSQDELRFCPKRDGLYEECYDPAFFVPLMNLCFGTEAYTHPAKPVQNGLLALTFAALSSNDKDMRLAAASAQLRYRSHFEQSKFFELPLWVQAYDNIQAGLAELRNSWMKHKKNSGTPRVPYIPCLFIAKTFNVTTDPTHVLYKHLTMFLRLKSVFSFNTIPEFNVLFFSPEVEHQIFRKFILELITNGIKTSADLFLLVSTNTFKVLMSFYGSSISNLEMNLQILSLMSTCAKIPGSAKIMLEHVGILSWFAHIISTLEFHQFDVIEGVITTLNNFWYALRATAGQFHNYAHICFQLHRLVMRLLPHLSKRISVANFAKLLNIMHKTASSQHSVLSAEQLQRLIDCAGGHFPEHIHTIASIKEFGGDGAVADAVYCEQLYAQKLPAHGIVALSSLRAYTIEWYKCQPIKAETEGKLEAETLDESTLNVTIA